MAICGIARGCAKPLSLRNGSVPWNTSGVVTPPKCGLVSLHHHLARIKERWIPGAVSRFGSDRHRRNPAVGRRVGGGPHSVLFRPLLQAPLGVSRCPIADRSRWRSRTTGLGGKRVFAPRIENNPLSRFGNQFRLGHGLKLADRLPAECQRDERTDRHNHEDRAEEDER
jgi:hypothetical protein